MYKKVSTDMGFVGREKNVEAIWKENKIFEQSMQDKKNAPLYTFYDGPPTANGKPHIGHVLTRVIKDMIPRYKTMKGYYVPRKAGWDTHGLPVELEVEKLLGLEGKEQIESYGMAPFISKCKESVWRYKEMWEDFSSTVGFWADMDNPYVTYDNEYIESVWWSLKTVWEKKLLYKGFKIVPYCPRCETPLSSHEVAQGYKNVKEHSAIVKFKLKDENAFILAWTTTPWTLPSNVALCVNPNETYVKVDFEGTSLYLAEALAETVLKEGFVILGSYKGKELEYREYEPLFNFAKSDKKGYYITCDEFVTLADGTGVVHIAPAFGEDDANVGRKYDLPFVQLVNSKGEATAETPWSGTFCKDTDKPIIIDLKTRGLLFASPVYEHSYPHCWRCDIPLIYYARESWFIKMTAVKDDLIRNNGDINWIPESIGKGRFGDWLENIQDWSISRNRYWGTPLNIWQCECGHQHAVGSIEELKSMSDNCPEDIELHRPFIDEVTIKCGVCGGQMQRVPEVIDCWYDSGAMPFAQHHYPFENKELFEGQFPADFISEAVDQTRGWFYSLLAISTLIFNKAPYKNVIVLGHVQDENGQKMSKSKGNAVDPFEALEKYGADAIRWYFYINSAPWLPNRFNGRTVIEGQRKFMGTLWNTYAFYVLYANIDKFNPSEYTMDYSSLSVMDRWLISRLNSTVKAVDENLEQYRIPEAARQLQQFIDEMSNWYVRRCRERFWEKEMTKDKINAYMTLYTALVEIAKASAPMIPFMTDEIYRNLVLSVDESAKASVHLCDYPTVDNSLIDEKLEKDMDLLLRIVTTGRAARNGANIKNRQPLGKIYVKSEETPEAFFQEIIREELNIKEAEFIADDSELLAYSFKPNLGVLGPKFGKQIGKIREMLSALDGAAAKKELDTTGVLRLALEDGDIQLNPGDLLIETVQKDGYYSVREHGITVALDTTITPELLEEGFVRELISKVQTMRKEANFEVVDHITLYQDGNDKISKIISNNMEIICNDVLADAIKIGEMGGVVKEWDINGESIRLGVEKCHL